MYISMTSCFGFNQWSSSCTGVITVCVRCSLFRFIDKKAKGNAVVHDHSAPELDNEMTGSARELRGRELQNESISVTISALKQRRSSALKQRRSSVPRRTGYVRRTLISAHATGSPTAFCIGNSVHTFAYNNDTQWQTVFDPFLL